MRHQGVYLHSRLRGGGGGKASNAVGQHRVGDQTDEALQVGYTSSVFMQLCLLMSPTPPWLLAARSTYP